MRSAARSALHDAGGDEGVDAGLVEPDLREQLARVLAEAGSGRPEAHRRRLERDDLAGLDDRPELAVLSRPPEAVRGEVRIVDDLRKARARDRRHAGGGELGESAR